MERKLASIQTIAALEPIENADLIEKAQVLGWTVVVKKGEFAVGDRCVFFEVDSVLPDTEWAAFLGEHKRLKTRRMRGVLSQGLALPTEPLGLYLPCVGEDVTEILGVTKYELPETADPTLLPWPSRVPKTEEVRIQSFPSLLDELRGLPYRATVKCDGTSFTAFHDGTELIVCSRNYRVVSGPHWEVAKRLKLEEKLQEFPMTALQGELVGPGIQKNRLGLKQPTVLFFNAYNILQGTHLDDYGLHVICEALGLETVPDAFFGDNFQYSLEELLELAKGNYAGTTNRREGVVIRAHRQHYSPTLQGRLSFKVLNNDFLLKDEV